MPLTLFRRHIKKCKHTSRTFRRCQCPIHVEGSLGGHLIRMSLDQSNWDAATRLIGKWTEAGAIGQVYGDAKPASEAIVDFLADIKQRGLAEATIGKYRLLLQRRLVPWAQGNNTPMLVNLDTHQLSVFRETWPGTVLVKQKTQERLKAFFGFCVSRGWLVQNPALRLSPYRVKQQPTLPFTTEEVDRIIAACDRYPLYRGEGNRHRMRAFVLMLRWTGLRIRDVVTMARHQVADGRVFLYTQKTGTPVHIPIPPVLVEALSKVPVTASAYLFWAGTGLPKTGVADWQRSLRKLFELANIDKGHAHRFRDTFAVEMLVAGVSLEHVAVLLGHASIKVTERHYAPWVLVRQLRLESSVRSIWDAPAGAAAATAGTPDPPLTAESESSTVKIA